MQLCGRERGESSSVGRGRKLLHPKYHKLVEIFRMLCQGCAVLPDVSPVRRRVCMSQPPFNHTACGIPALREVHNLPQILGPNMKEVFSRHRCERVFLCSFDVQELSPILFECSCWLTPLSYQSIHGVSARAPLRTFCFALHTKKNSDMIRCPG